MATDHKAIAKEAKRRSLADDGKSSREERFALRNAIRAEQGLGAEKRQRGGLAGVYDRNKDYIVPAASIVAGLIPGVNAAVPALLGAARGFDREGQAGIGFDLGQGLAGAASGYGLGKVGGAIGNLAGLGGASGAVPAASVAADPAAAEMAAMTRATGGGAAMAGAAPVGAVPASRFSLGGFAGKGLDFLKGNGGANAIAALQAVTGALDAKKARDLTDKAVGMDTARYAENAPLRAAGRAAMLAPVPSQDTSGLRALAAPVGNPFARRAR